MSSENKKPGPGTDVAVADGTDRVITPGGIELENRQGHWQEAQEEWNVPPELVVSIGWGKGSFLATVYDLVATKMGIQFGKPEIVSEDGYRVKVAVGAEYWNSEGRKKSDSEVYEIDCALMYEKSRFGYERVRWEGRGDSRKKVVEETAVIKVIRDPKRPELPPKVEVVLSDKAEAELYENFLTLRRNKLAKAITCAHRRLTQRALGIKGFDYDPKDPAWKDKVYLLLRKFLPVGTDRKAGVKAINDLGGDALALEAKEDGQKQEQTDGNQEPENTTDNGKTGVAGEDIGPGPEVNNRETKETKKAPAGTPAGLICTAEGCGVKVSKKVAEYSEKHHGKVLCMDCQKGA